MLCCRVGRHIGADHTHTFLEATTKAPKTARNAVAGDHFKPIQAEFKLAATAACDYTRRPEVTGGATRHLRLDSSEGCAAVSAQVGLAKADRANDVANLLLDAVSWLGHRFEEQALPPDSDDPDSDRVAHVCPRPERTPA